MTTLSHISRTDKAIKLLQLPYTKKI